MAPAGWRRWRRTFQFVGKIDEINQRFGAEAERKRFRTEERRKKKNEKRGGSKIEKLRVEGLRRDEREREIEKEKIRLLLLLRLLLLPLDQAKEAAAEGWLSFFLFFLVKRKVNVCLLLLLLLSRFLRSFFDSHVHFLSLALKTFTVSLPLFRFFLKTTTLYDHS